MAGVAPNVAIHSLRVQGPDGKGKLSDLFMAIEYVLQHPEIRVVNLSISADMLPSLNGIKEALQKLENTGVVLCVAAGNGKDLNSDGIIDEVYNTEDIAPAGFDLGIVVSAYDTQPSADGPIDQDFADFSNYGSAVDIAAPGTRIKSTYLDNTYIENEQQCLYYVCTFDMLVAVKHRNLYNTAESIKQQKTMYISYIQKKLIMKMK